MDNKFERVTEKFDPRRCKGSSANGPCPYVGSVGGFCPMHSGGGLAWKISKENRRNYMLGQWQARVEQFADSTEVKSLREEIGIARLLLENMLTRYSTSDELFLGSGKIADLITRIEKLVATCHKLELANETLLDRHTVLKMAATIIEIIGEFVKDDNALDTIGNKIVEAIVTKHNKIDEKVVMN